MKTGMDKKGFFFVLVSFILISYILITTYTWVRAVEMSEKTYSEALKASSLQLMTDQVTDARMVAFADLAVYHAFYAVMEHSVLHPVEPGPSDDEYQHIREAMAEVLLYGRADGSHFTDGEELVYTGDNYSAATYAGFQGALNESLGRSGFEILDFAISNISFNETEDPLIFHVNYTINTSLEDTQSDTSLVKTFNINQLINVTGFYDPGIAREAHEQLGLGVRIEKPVYMAPYEVPDDIQPGNGRGVDQGQGWFYGPVVMADDADTILSEDRWLYAIAGNYSDIVGVMDHGEFGAYIQISAPEIIGYCDGNEIEDNVFNAIGYSAAPVCDPERRSEFVDKPFIVDTSFDIDDYEHDSYASPPWPRISHRMLFIASASPDEVERDPEEKLRDARIYDIEMLRDYVICSYYSERPDEGASYLQRFFEDWRSRESPNGLETTVVGIWAGGNMTPDWDPYSRVDREFFELLEGDNIRGLPGCKFVGMCVNPSDVGHFKFSHGAEEYYFGSSGDDPENIGCNDGRATCEEE